MSGSAFHSSETLELSHGGDFVFGHESGMLPAAPEEVSGPILSNVQRSRWLPVFFLPSVTLGFLSWCLGGVPFITDLAFLWLTALCAVLMVRELVVFGGRLGLGGILLFGGTLVWFCFDYDSHWLGTKFEIEAFPALVVAKSTFYHSLFIACASQGLQSQRGRWFSRLLSAIPEPTSGNFYLAMLVLAFLTGISVYFLFTKDSWYVAMYMDMTSNRGAGARWTVGRTGNLNYNWGGYIAQIREIGQMSGIFGAFYATLIARSLPGKLIGWFAFVFWLAFAIGSGSRGQVFMTVLPAAVLLFLKHHVRAIQFARPISVRGYVVGGGMLVAALLVAQIQISFRNRRLTDVVLTDAKVSNIQGNTMFSEGLDAFQIFPDYRDFFYNRFPGEGAIRPIPEVPVRFLLGLIPRALWPTKPIDAAWAWRAAADTKGREMQGTTISTGLVGWWYCRYGIMGVIEGGLLFGWLIRATERAMQESDGRPMVLFVVLGFAAILNGMFRDFVFLGINTMLPACVLLYIAVRVQRAFFSAPTGPSAVW